MCEKCLVRIQETSNCTKIRVMVHVSGGRGFVWGFREGRGELSSGLSQPGEKSVIFFIMLSKFPM